MRAPSSGPSSSNDSLEGEAGRTSRSSSASKGAGGTGITAGSGAGEPGDRFLRGQRIPVGRRRVAGARVRIARRVRIRDGGVRLRRRPLFARLFEADFLVERVPQVVRRALEFVEALAER